MLRASLLSTRPSVAAAEPQRRRATSPPAADHQAEAQARLTACNAVIADDKVTGKDKAFALLVSSAIP